MKLKRVFTTIIGLIFALAIINVIIEDPGSIFIFGAFGYGIYLLINRKKFSSFSKKRKIISIVSIVIMLTIGSALASPTSNTNNTTKSNLLAKEETTEAGNDVDTETDTNVDTEDNAGIETETDGGNEADIDDDKDDDNDSSTAANNNTNGDEDSNLDVNKDKTSKSTSSTSTTSSSSTSSQSSKSPIKYTVATVTRHVDGDTVYVKIDGQEYKLRLIGVNTPETKHPQKGVEYYGKEASNFTKSKLLGKTVYLEKDVSETDKYGRLLRYVWLEPPTKLTKEEIKTKMFNAILVANGYAQVATYPPDVKYQDYFLEFEREARSKNIGLWGKPDEPTSAAKSGSGSTTSNSSGSKSTSTSSNTSSKSGSSNTSSGSSGSGQVGSETNKAYTYMGNSNTMKLHLTTCTHAKRTSEKNRVYFNSRSEAINKGYVPCKVCNP